MNMDEEFKAESDEGEDMQNSSDNDQFFEDQHVRVRQNDDIQFLAQ